MIQLTDPLTLTVGKEYNLNNVKQVKVTDDFLGLEKEVIQCQNHETYEDCRTKHYIDSLLENCQCLPFSVGMRDKVRNSFNYLISLLSKLTL